MGLEYCAVQGSKETLKNDCCMLTEHIDQLKELPMTKAKTV
jgi:hypothetical protein